MSLVDVLEDERRETADTDSPSASRRGLKDSFLTVRNMLDIPSNTSTPSSSRERRSSPFAPGNGDAAQSTLGNKTRKQSASAEAMAAIFGGAPKDFQISSKTRGSGRHNSTVGIGAKSRSPSSRLHRSSSPGMGLLNNNRSSPMHIMTDSSDFNDIDSATEKISDSNLKSKRKGPGVVFKDNAENGRRGSADSSNDIRLEEDKPGGEDADEGAIESSDDEEEAKSSEEDEDESTSDRKRGRGRNRIDKESDVSNVDSDESGDDPYASLYGQNESTSQAKSTLAAAEEERMFSYCSGICSQLNIFSRHGPIQSQIEAVRACHLSNWSWRRKTGAKERRSPSQHQLRLHRVRHEFSKFLRRGYFRYQTCSKVEYQHVTHRHIGP